MIKRLKRRLKKKNDHGSSFVLVIVATTFMCILASSLLVGAMMTYKLKFYKLNSVNNFYEVEKALDEMYAGVGAIVNDQLYAAYTTTAELMIVYDTEKGEYTTLDKYSYETSDGKTKSVSPDALFSQLFMTGVANEDTFKSVDKLIAKLGSFITNVQDDNTNPDGVILNTDDIVLVYTDTNGRTSTQWMKNGKTKKRNQSGYDKNNISTITIKNVSVEREISYSGSTAVMASGRYRQSITTDIVLTRPQYSAFINSTTTSSASLYDYAILADMGIEADIEEGTAADINIVGNVYTASDYYNKDYNGSEDTKISNKYENKPTTNWGTTDESAYSGIYASGDNTNLNLSSDIVVCSGSVAAFNGANITLSGRTQNLSELWTDSIVIGGTEGGSLTAAADAYVFDDTELNAEKSNLEFTQGRYFGYSYNANDTRSIDYLKSKGYLATGYSLKSHFSDSAIIVNGKDSTLNLKGLSSLYIAGKSYIEFSKVAASSVSADDTSITVDKNADFAYTTLKDYSTGQSLDVKTNQLMFLTQWSVVSGSEKTDPDTGITTATLKFPKTFGSDSNIIDLYKDFIDDISSDELTVTAIKQTVSGHDYYYLYIEDDKDASGVSKAEKFVEKYYDLLSTYGDEITGKLYNVRKYETFDVNLLLPAEDKINANAAVTDQDSDDNLFYRASSDLTTLNVETELTNATNNKTFMTLLCGDESVSQDNKDSALSSIITDASSLSGSGTWSTEEKISNVLSYMYINMKDHLSVLNAADETDEDKDVNAWKTVGYTESGSGYTYTYDSKNDKYSYDYSITPLANYVDFTKVNALTNDVNEVVKINDTSDDSHIVISSKSVTVESSEADGSYDGIIIAAGDVTFGSSVKSFRGMIITGSKLIIDHSMTITSDDTYIASLLDKCSKISNDDSNAKANMVTTGILKNYVAGEDAGGSSETSVTISDISYGDILLFQNWKKNVSEE